MHAAGTPQLVASFMGCTAVAGCAELLSVLWLLSGSLRGCARASSCSWGCSSDQPNKQVASSYLEDVLGRGDAQDAGEEDAWQTTTTIQRQCCTLHAPINPAPPRDIFQR